MRNPQKDLIRDANGPCTRSANRLKDWTPLAWRGQMVTLRQGPTDPAVFARAINKMIEANINWLVIEVERGLRYDSHPKVAADWALSKATLKGLLDAARRAGIQCVPLLPSLPHTGYIAEAYPEIAETHCVCPRREFTQTVLNDLSTELIELFEPSLFHIAHDEMLSAFPRHQRLSALQCPLCRGDDAAAWFRDSILRRYDYLKAQGITTMLWADMFLDPDAFRAASPWMGSFQDFNGGPPDHIERALDELPRDIVMCDWHYNPSCQYPTLRYLQDKGFDVLGCPKSNVKHNAFLLTRHAQRTRTPHLLGMLGTNWNRIDPENEACLLQDIAENGAIFGGCDNPALRQKAEAAESRRFEVGAFEHVVDFAGEDSALLETAWYESLNQNAFGTIGLGLGSGKKGKLCLPIFGLPDCAFEQLEVELALEGEFPGPGRTGLSVDGGRTYTYRPLQARTDWSDVAAGYSRALWVFEMCNLKARPAGQPAKIGFAKCLDRITLRGRLGPRKAAGSA